MVITVGANCREDEAVGRGVDVGFVVVRGRLQKFATLLAFFLTGKPKVSLGAANRECSIWELDTISTVRRSFDGNGHD